MASRGLDEEISLSPSLVQIFQIGETYSGVCIVVRLHAWSNNATGRLWNSAIKQMTRPTRACALYLLTPPLLRILYCFVKIRCIVKKKKKKIANVGTKKFID